MACGCFQNVVAVGAGFTEGLGYGDNTKAAVIRLGLMEMTEFCRRFFESMVNILTKIQIKLKSCHTVSVIDYSKVKVWVYFPSNSHPYIGTGPQHLSLVGVEPTQR